MLEIAKMEDLGIIVYPKTNRKHYASRFTLSDETIIYNKPACDIIDSSRKGPPVARWRSDRVFLKRYVTPDALKRFIERTINKQKHAN